MFVGEPEACRVHLLLERGTPSGRIVPGRDNAVFVYEYTSKLGLMMIREGRDSLCCSKERLLCFGGIDGHNIPPHIQYSTVWGFCQEGFEKKFGEGEYNKRGHPKMPSPIT